ncbi:MAG: NAD(P)-binding protein [Hyphomicrobiales bacterium]|nr:NAD(P)-binding protein [Hyphomicrobiales bacterium]MCP5000554.1 NAD(P)-binding protein [Hyphomicrobiales bacterium]
MQHVETIIVGGGPSGSTCAWQLGSKGHEVLVLDKAEFPRLKLCAGWITEKAMEDLQLTQETYPHPLLELDIKAHYPKIPFALSWFPTKGKNYSIRRTEFDAWLLERSAAPVANHTVKKIRREGDRYIIDDTFSCRNLVGAGGTMCPVRRNLFGDERRKSRRSRPWKRNSNIRPARTTATFISVSAACWDMPGMCPRAMTM